MCIPSFVLQSQTFLDSYANGKCSKDASDSNGKIVVRGAMQRCVWHDLASRCMALCKFGLNFQWRELLKASAVFWKGV